MDINNPCMKEKIVVEHAKQKQTLATTSRYYHRSYIRDEDELLQNQRQSLEVQRVPLSRGIAAVPKKSDRWSVDSNFETIPTKILRKSISYTYRQEVFISYTIFTLFCEGNPKPAQIWSKSNVAKEDPECHKNRNHND